MPGKKGDKPGQTILDPNAAFLKGLAVENKHFTVQHLPIKGELENLFKQPSQLNLPTRKNTAEDARSADNEPDIIEMMRKFAAEEEAKNPPEAEKKEEPRTPTPTKHQKTVTWKDEVDAKRAAIKAAKAEQNLKNRPSFSPPGAGKGFGR